MLPKPLRRMIPFLVIALFHLTLCAAGAETPPPAVNGKGVAKSPPAATVAQGVDRERTRKQMKRLLLRALDDLQVERKFTLEDIRELEQRIDTVTPLESTRRNEDFQALLDWHHGYLERLGEREEEFERRFAELAAVAGTGGKLVEMGLEAMAQEEKERAQEQDIETDIIDEEKDRLSKIYDRKRLLQGRSVDLDSRLAQIGRRLKDRQRSASDKQKDLKEAERIRSESSLAQAEFNALPAVDEDLLRHYAEMGARRRCAGDQVALKAAEYEALRRLIAMLNEGKQGDYDATEGYRQVIAMYDDGIGRLAKMRAELDLWLARTSPAETVRKSGQSAELTAYFQRLRERFVERINQLENLKGAYEADLGEMRQGGNR